MKRIIFAIALGMGLAIGCGTNKTYRSADFNGDKVYTKGGSAVPQLRENEVLGLKPGDSISEDDIRRVLDESRSVRIKPGSRLLLVQSGAASPASAMVQELAKHFTVVPHTGIPSELTADSGGAATGKALRLAAAHSQAETILVYWGNLEMKRNDLPTSIVSWVPVIDFAVPDEHQKVRMSLKLALVDVRTGNWATFRTEAIEEDSLTTRYAREREHNGTLERSKQRLYQLAVQKLTSGYLAGR
jgi:hypothetical protein